MPNTVEHPDWDAVPYVSPYGDQGPHPAEDCGEGETDQYTNDNPVDTCLGPDDPGVGPWMYDEFD